MEILPVLSFTFLLARSLSVFVDNYFKEKRFPIGALVSVIACYVGLAASVYPFVLRYLYSPIKSLLLF